MQHAAGHVPNRQDRANGLVVRPAALALMLLLATACAAPPPSVVQGQAGGAVQPPRPRSLTIGITSNVPAMSLAVATGTPTGGWMALTELHTDGLVTADTRTRDPVGRLAEAAPSLENGGITMLPDGQMKVVFKLRQGITWHDGSPFTADDMVFSYEIGGPNGIPTPLNGAVPYMSSVEAVDPQTLVVYYRTPFFQGAVLGPQMFWPLPQHILGEAYQRFLATRNLEELLGSPYWS